MISAISLFIKEHLNTKTVRNWLFVTLLFIFLSNILRDSIQGVENSLLILMILTGLMTGWLFSISSLRAWSAAISSLLIGVIILIIRIGRLGNLLVNVFRQITLLLGDIWQRIINTDHSINTQDISLLLSDLQTRVITLGSRLFTWFVNIFQGSPLYDPVAIAIIWGFLIWIISLWTMWLIFRHQKPILGITPALILASPSLVYTDKSAYHLS